MQKVKKAALLALVAGCVLATGCQDPGDKSSARTRVSFDRHGSGEGSGHGASEAGSRNEKVRRPAPPTPEQAQLLENLKSIDDAFAGNVGIAVRDVDSGWEAGDRATALMPQQSVSKLWVALTALDLVDRGKLALSDKVVVGPRDLTVFHQPIRELALRPGGYQTDYGDLLWRALTRSDNTANDVILRRVGGPKAVRAMLKRKGLWGIRFGPGERLLQSRIAGLEWKPHYSYRLAFYEARDKLPHELRQQAFARYLRNPIDGASAKAIASALARLARGELLSQSSTHHILDILSHTHSGPRRLKAGAPAGWHVAHKTGTGQVLGATQSGYNDVGIVTAPSGRSYAVAVMIGETTEPYAARMDLMQNVVRAVANYENVREAPQPASVRRTADLEVTQSNRPS